MSRRELGPDHPEVGGRALSLAYWLTEEGKFDEAGLLVEEAMAIRRKALGPDHPQVGGTLTVKANLMLATQRTKKPRTRGRSETNPLASLPADSWQVAAAMNAEGAALVGLGHFEQAEPLLVHSLDALGRHRFRDSTRGKHRLVELYEAWGKPEQATKAGWRWRVAK